MQNEISTTTTDFTAALTSVLDEYFNRHAARALEISPYYGTLWTEIARLVHAGGKKLRPKMTLMAYQAFGGTDSEKILPIAAAQELLHVGLLIHDDIIDRDTIRYGVDNIDGGYRKLYESLVGEMGERTHYAQSAAMLAGDLLLTGAQQLMLESNIEPARINEVQKILGTGIFEVIGGELIDTESAFREAGTISAETVARYKTASYSFITPLLIGAVLAGATKEEQVKVREFAEAIGVAFQLRDDLIGLFGDESVTGKSTVGDIREGKRTYLIEQFYLHANDDQRTEFERYFGKPEVTPQDIERVKQLLIDSGAQAKTEDAITGLEVKAQTALEGLTNTAQLKELITLATRRSK
jgi:geranylgeranyl diphosphate synthase type II